MTPVKNIRVDIVFLSTKIAKYRDISFPANFSGKKRKFDCVLFDLIPSLNELPALSEVLKLKGQLSCY